jgi:hypothetical protein
MRYVSSSFFESILRRGKSLEQFLGGLLRNSEQCISWVEIRPGGGGTELWSFVAPDCGDEEHLDLYEFIGDDEGVLEATFETPADAFTYAEEKLGACSDRWVNQFMTQDEYLDFILAYRPASWPQVRG